MRTTCARGERRRHHFPDIEVLPECGAATAPFEGKPYDLTFEWSDTRIYCSELVWKLYDRALGIQIGRLQKLSDFDLTDRVVRAKMTERYGTAIPMDSTVISPNAMFESPDLKVVAQSN